MNKHLQKELSDAAFASNNEDVEIYMQKLTTVRKALNAIKKEEKINNI